MSADKSGITKTNKPIIAIDCDDVLSATTEAFIEYCNTTWGLSLSVDDIDEDWGKMWQVDSDETMRRAAEFHKSGIIADYAHYDEALPVLQRLTRHFTLVVATSRNSKIREATISWIDQRYPDIFADIYFSGIYDGYTDNSACALTKAEMLQKIGAAYLIDDQPKYIAGAVDVGVRGLLFGDYVWNRDASLPYMAVRCHDWCAVGVYFDQLIGEI